MNEEDKSEIINDLNLKIGCDINNLSCVYQIESDLVSRRDQLQSCLVEVNNEVPTKLSSAVKKAELNSKQIADLKYRSDALNKKVLDFFNRTEPLRTELDKRFGAIKKLEDVLAYLKSFEKVDELCLQMKQTNDEEQLVLLYGELKEMCRLYVKGHQAAYIKEYTHYWHNILKDKLTKNYEDLLKLLKWPIASGAENSPPPKEIMNKFCNATKHLFLIEEPEKPVFSTTICDDIGQELNPCLPVRILLRPLKKRFAFHFTGPRQTARIDRPEWFLTQTLTWIKDHQDFVRNNVQPVADKLQLKNIRVVNEFNAGLISLAGERLHTVLSLYNQGSKEIGDVDAAFAHAVDEALGFHKEVVAVTGNDANTVLPVLTRAETFVRWLAVEKKYALAKLDEALESPQWHNAIASGVGSAVGEVLWVPRAADWFISLLCTIQQRYEALPQPGHRLQFLELQLELLEEWRVRLAQLLGASVDALCTDTFLSGAGDGHPVTAVINAAHHTRTVLLQWAHSLHYLQLHYYRSQFQHFTQQHHEELPVSSVSVTQTSVEVTPEQDKQRKSKTEGEIEETMSLKDVEVRAKKLALNEVSRIDSTATVSAPQNMSIITDPLPIESDVTEEAGVFAEAPALLAHVRDAGLASLSEHIMLEFKATFRDYKKQKWHAMLVVENLALTVSAPLCRPLSSLCARLSHAASQLAPPLAARLRARLAAELDQYIFEEVVLESWFNTGGTLQFTHDVKRNLVPAFAPPNKVASRAYIWPKLLESCKLLNMDYDDARRLRGLLAKRSAVSRDSLLKLDITHIQPNEALQILNQRTDLTNTGSPSSVMELF